MTLPSFALCLLPCGLCYAKMSTSNFRIQPLIFVNPSEREATSAGSSHQGTKAGSEWMDLSDASSLDWSLWAERWHILIGQTWSSGCLWRSRLAMQWALSIHTEPWGSGAPWNKLRRKMGFDSGQTTIMSTLLTKHQTKCWPERILCLQLTGWDPGTAWLSILLKVGGLNWRLWVIGNIPQSNQMIGNKAV